MPDEAPKLAAAAPGIAELSLEAGYGVKDGCTVRIERDKNGDERVDVLATFVAKIEEEITVDDGIETSRLFRISGRLAGGQRLRDALVPASEFEGLSWVLRNWGLRALVFSGGGRRDHLRTAIQLMSSRAASRTVYTHTGWRQEGDEWIYLYQGGAVGAEGVEVRLDGPLERFALPARAEDADEALAASLGLLDCGPADVTVPLLGAVYAAPLSFIVNPDFAVWVVGLTGSLKSELASLAQRHFGPFTRKTLPGSWSSTGNSLEQLLSVTKDMLAVIDDFAPQADAQTQREQTKRAEVLLRNVGNHAGRGRLKPDLTQRPVRPPRALVLCTGEDHPPTPSIVARLVLVEVDRSRLNLAAVTRLQNQGETLPHAMRAYVEWLRPQIASLRESLPRALSDLMTGTFGTKEVGGHMRAPSGLSTLFLGVAMCAEFARARGVLTAERSEAMLKVAEEALLSIGRRQAQASRARTPAVRFVEALAGLIGEGKVWLRGPPGTVPSCIGPSTGFVGWRERDVVHVLLDPALRAVTASLRQAGEPWRLSTSRLIEDLVKEGIADRTESGQSPGVHLPGHGAPRGARERVLVLRASALFPADVKRRPTPNRPALVAPDGIDERLSAGRDSGGTLH